MFEYLITRPLGWIIEQIYNLVSNYGLSIILFTVVVKLILLPLNVRSQRAMRKQQKVQPILAQLQEKYKNDQEKLQREIMKLYKENNISMTGGCLPMLIQFPILIGLYQVIQKPLSYLFGVNWAEADIINRVYDLQDKIVEMGYDIGNLANYTMEQLANMSQIQLSNWASIINGPTDPWHINFNFLGLDLSQNPSVVTDYLMKLDFSSNPAVFGLLLIPVLAVVSSVLTTKLTQKQTGQTNSANQQANQMTKSMTMMMPIMTAVFTFTLPAGMGVYWIISSVMQIVQQIVLNKVLEKNDEEIEIKIPERKQLHGKKSKKR